MKVQLLALTLALSPAAYAMTPFVVFDPQIRSQAASLHVTNIFSNESTNQKARPVWAHGGDSISTAFGTRTLLSSVYWDLGIASNKAPTNVDVITAATPSTDNSWYAGILHQKGLLGRLENLSNEEWVLASVATAGTKIDRDRNPTLWDFTKVPTAERSRVKLVTFSFGSNDLCDQENRQRRPQLTQELVQLKSIFPNARVIVWGPVDVVFMRDEILRRIDALPDTVSAEEQTNAAFSPALAKQRLKAYCSERWQNSCPNAIKKPAETNAYRNEILGALHDAGLEVIDPLKYFVGFDPRTVLAMDCFHPSGDTERGITAAFYERLINP